MQWNSPKNAAKTGGPAGGWSPQPMAATTGAGYRPMVSFSFSVLFVKYFQHVSSDCHKIHIHTHICTVFDVLFSKNNHFFNRNLGYSYT